MEKAIYIIILAILIILIVIETIFIFILNRRNLKNNPTIVSYGNGIYTVKQFENHPRSQGSYRSYKYKLKNGKIVAVWDKVSTMVIVVMVIAVVLLVPSVWAAIKYNEYLPACIVGASIDFGLTWILPSIRARRFLKKELKGKNYI